MMMNCYKVKVYLMNGEVIEFDNVSNYSVDKEHHVLLVEVNGFRQIFNMDYVIFAGKAIDIDN